MSSNFIISLDFELMWGVRDHESLDSYGEAILGARAAVPKLLRVFRSHGISATWATVGLLFARSQREMLHFSPRLLPSYARKQLDPYPQIAALKGMDESSAPHYFGRSLIDRILNDGAHELASHTYSHYLCLEPGQTTAQFKADLAANIAIASSAGCKIETLVFSRNQWTEEHVDAIVEAGILAFRGNQPGYMYLARPNESNSMLVRGLRLVDGVMPLTGKANFGEPTSINGALNIPASRFLRPWKPSSASYSLLHIRRVQAEMTKAARSGRNYHLWWHPHNMGRYLERNFSQLSLVMNHFVRLRDSYGMRSATMATLLHESPLHTRANRT